MRRTAEISSQKSLSTKVLPKFGLRGMFTDAVTMTNLLNLRHQSTGFLEHYLKTFTATLEQLKKKASRTPLEESNAVIMFLNSVDASPFATKDNGAFG